MKYKITMHPFNLKACLSYLNYTPAYYYILPLIALSRQG